MPDGPGQPPGGSMTIERPFGIGQNKTGAELPEAVDALIQGRAEAGLDQGAVDAHDPVEIGRAEDLGPSRHRGLPPCAIGAP